MQPHAINYGNIPLNGSSRQLILTSCAANCPTILGKAARVMARQASRILGGDAAADIPIEIFRAPELVVNMAAAGQLKVLLPLALHENAPVIY